jgi:hypothetical protein
VHFKHLQYFGFGVLVMGLAGCAANIPKVSYNGPIPAKSAFTNQAVAIHTSVNGDNFQYQTLPGNAMIHDYNLLLAQGLKSDGAQAGHGSSAAYVIDTHIVPSGKHRYMFRKNWDFGRTLIGSLPFAAIFTGRPETTQDYTIVAHFDDDVQIMRHGKVVWHKNIPVTVKTRVHGTSEQHLFSSGHSGKSKAENIYRILQSRAVAQILKASENLERQGSATQIIAAGATVPPVS